MSVSNSECQVVFSERRSDLQWRAPLAVWDQPVTKKTLQSDEFTPAAWRGTKASGFTLRLLFSVFTTWLGVDSAVLTHVTISRWRWASATFKKKKSCCNSSENRAVPLTRWHKPPTEREGEQKNKKHWRKLDQVSRSTAVRFLFKLCWEELMRLFAEQRLRSCVLTPATPRFDAGSRPRSHLSETAGSTDVTIIQGLLLDRLS